MGDKRLYKSSENSMLCGVCGGIAEYFDIDPTLVKAWDEEFSADRICLCDIGLGVWNTVLQGQ